MKLILIPIIVDTVAQIIKFLTKSLKQKRLSRRSWLGYGGWPSVHTATVSALLTIIWLTDGIESTGFAVALVMAVLTVRDALGLRNFLGEHGKVLNLLISDLPIDKKRQYPEHLREHLGHTIPEVAGGAIIGFALSWLIYIIL